MKSKSTCLGAFDFVQVFRSRASLRDPPKWQIFVAIWLKIAFSKLLACNRKQAVVPKGRYNRKNCTKSNSWPYNRKSFMKSKKISPRTALQSKIGPTIEKVRVEVPTLPTIEKIARNRTGGLQSKSGPIIELDASYNRNPSPIIEK